jgi:hypothetical protein
LISFRREKLLSPLATDMGNASRIRSVIHKFGNTSNKETFAKYEYFNASRAGHVWYVNSMKALQFLEQFSNRNFAKFVIS